MIGVAVILIVLFKVAAQPVPRKAENLGKKSPQGDTARDVGKNEAIADGGEVPQEQFQNLAEANSKYAQQRRYQAAVASARKDNRILFARRVDNIRTGPSTAHTVARQTMPLEPLPYLAKEGKWYKLITEDDSEQWVHESVVMTKEQQRAWREEKDTGGAIELVCVPKNDSAPLLKEPGDSRNTVVLAKIAGPRELQILEAKDVTEGRGIIRFFKVEYEGKKGWINQYYTTGEVLTRTSKGDAAALVPGMDGPRLVEFSQAVKQQWIESTLRDTAITYIEFGNDTTMWVRLTRDKYTTKELGVLLAENIAKQYRLQTGYDGCVAVHILHPDSNKEWAVGRLP